jgi:transcriptional regulator with XRE-family HTH domain
VVYKSERDYLLAFGNNLKSIRKSKGFTQADLANDLDIEISQISRIERGIINTTIWNSYRIAQVLQVDAELLFNF